MQSDSIVSSTPNTSVVHNEIATAKFTSETKEIFFNMHFPVSSTSSKIINKFAKDGLSKIYLKLCNNACLSWKR